jgi:hypothetical protein
MVETVGNGFFRRIEPVEVVRSGERGEKRVVEEV